MKPNFKLLHLRYFVTVFSLFYFQFAYTQNFKQLSSFTTKEGLPSNHLYDAIEDSRGFLWVATDNGIAQFDGKYFKNYSIKDGLPSNDVIQVMNDGSGTLWVNCYKQLPAYFDELSNRFVVLTATRIYNEMGKSYGRFYLMADSSIGFINNISTAFLNNRKLTRCEVSKDTTKIYFPRYEIMLFDKGKPLFVYTNKNCIEKLYLSNNEKPTHLDSFPLKFRSPLFFTYKNELITTTEKGLLKRWKNISLAPMRFNVDSIMIDAPLKGLKFNDNFFYGNTSKNHIFFVKRKDFSLRYNIKIPELVNSVYVDKNQHLWVCTLDKGLLLYTNNGINTLPISDKYTNTNFLSLAINTEGKMLVGNYYGELLKIEKDKTQKITIPKVGNSTWVRKTFFIKNKTIAVCDEIVNVNNSKNIIVVDKEMGMGYISAKTALPVNDSIILLGTILGLYQLNINTEKFKKLDSEVDRILSLVKANDSIFYYVGIDGINSFNYKQNLSTVIPIAKLDPSEKVNLIALTQDGYLWANTSLGNFFVLKNEKQIAKIIYENNTLPENITTLMPYKNQLWIGSKTGIAIIKYNIESSKINTNLQFLTMADGLPSNTINEFAVYQDTVFAATEKGIAVIPPNYTYNNKNIFALLTAVKINAINFPIANFYNLKSNQKNISLGFSGVELTGHFKRILYALDNDKTFTELNGNTLNLQLDNGKHVLFVKAADVNNNESNKVLKLQFNIHTDFYNTAWFWLITGILSTAVFVWFLNYNKIKQQQQLLKQQLALEQQRNKITADLHDDIGASLSSLQVNSAVANRLMDKDLLRAKAIVQKLEIQSGKIAEQIGDFIWSMKPGKEAFISMSARIKNFANEILGATDVNYEVNIDPWFDTEITDATLRKNIVLITKEAINNAAKYSKASNIYIRFTKEKTGLIITVQDDGVGFTDKNIKGNGIGNMQKRAIECNGIFEITGNNGGTTVKLILPVVP